MLLCEWNLRETIVEESFFYAGLEIIARASEMPSFRFRKLREGCFFGGGWASGNKLYQP